jgi:hypothetical protein
MIASAPPSFNVFLYFAKFNIHYHCFKVHISRIAPQRTRIKVRPGLQQSDPAPAKRESTQKATIDMRTELLPHFHTFLPISSCFLDSLTPPFE